MNDAREHARKDAVDAAPMSISNRDALVIADAALNSYIKNTTHTRESELRDMLVKAREWIGDWGHINDGSQQAYTALVKQIDAALSTPIPLTPSDEIVEAATKAYCLSWGLNAPEDMLDRYKAMRAAITAALNLMGGDTK